MATLTPAQIAGHAAAAGFTGEGLRWAVAVALAESGGNTTARHVNGSGRTASVDRGLWQINTRWHPEVTDAQAYDPAGAAKAAYAISKAGRDWHEWSTYTNGAAAAQLARATAAASSPATAGATNVGLLDDTIQVPGLGALPRSWFESGAAAAGDTKNVLDGLGRVAAIIGSVVAKAAKWVSDSHNWLRVLFVVAGSAATLAGLAMLANSGVGGPVGAAAGTVTKAAGALPTGRAVKAAKAVTKAAAAKPAPKPAA